ncbi:predicted protein [Uncinocarpus reesii 1704]|uniref:Uncharacterized protein n=1 Tax=Uncinocarpus reesii (strain UAMH 1704) TaxID=336963 RepID=C4JU40_UNCRE|nr:uncharacterized protein UREG_05979 [Uncinocarpus reesii 1704]EEP81137.1 predicted protein [Uncinocarpus reesii 1704]
MIAWWAGVWTTQKKTGSPESKFVLKKALQKKKKGKKGGSFEAFFADENNINTSWSWLVGAMWQEGMSFQPRQSSKCLNFVMIIIRSTARVLAKEKKGSRGSKNEWTKTTGNAGMWLPEFKIRDMRASGQRASIGGEKRESFMPP